MDLGFISVGLINCYVFLYLWHIDEFPFDGDGFSIANYETCKISLLMATSNMGQCTSKYSVNASPYL